jgi:CrcB protein
MLNVLAIFIGGGLGSVSRYFVAMLLKMYDLNFPIGTLSVNILGSFILGFVTAYFWSRAPFTDMHDTVRLAITIGFCGGLTTFSTFSWETFDLIKQGDYLLAILYTFVSVFVCVLAVSLGAFLSKYV